MKPIPSSFSHMNLERKKDKLENEKWVKPQPLQAVLKSPPKHVATYDDLVRNVAQILHRNRNLTLFYRGQSSDYKSEGITSIMPSIFRKKKGEEKLLLKERFEKLNELSEK